MADIEINYGDPEPPDTAMLTSIPHDIEEVDQRGDFPDPELDEESVKEELIPDEFEGHDDEDDEEPEDG